MPKPKQAPYVSTGVNLECDVMTFLDQIAADEDRPRSYIINRIVREYAERRGTPLPRKRPGNTPSEASIKN